jgi:hypothetical protein
VRLDGVYRDARGRSNAVRAARGIDPSAAERFTLRQIGDRDGWVCQLCRLPVDPHTTRAENAALVASIDHIERYGPHTRENVQLTHLWCNGFRDHCEYVGLEPTTDHYRVGLNYRLTHPGTKMKYAARVTHRLMIEAG